MIRKISHFFQLPFYEKCNYLALVWAKVKTDTLYRCALKALGKSCMIKNPLLLKNAHYITLKDCVIVRDDARLECIAQKGDQTFRPHLILEEGVSIEQRCHITVADELIVGKNTIISFDVMMTDVDHDYYTLNTPIGQQALHVKKTRIGENCFLGGGVKIQAGTILGKHCVVGANAVVRGEFPDYCVIVGIPAKIVKRYDVITKQWKKTDAKGNFRDEV